LEKLGRVMHRTRNGYIVVVLSGEKLPPLNTPVYREGARRVGVLLDIIGPVKTPYAVVKPDSAGVEVREGEELYYRRPLPRRGRPRGKKTRRRERSTGPPSRRGRKR